MKKTTVLILCLALIGAACLPVPTVEGGSVTETPAGFIYTEEVYSGEVYWIPTITPTKAAKICYQVSGAGALHLRSGSSVDYPVVGWLIEGDVVELVHAIDPEWFYVRFGALHGYARAIYLKIKECE